MWLPDKEDHEKQYATMRNTLRHFLAVLLLSMVSIALSAQNTMSLSQFQKASYKEKKKQNPYSMNYKAKSVQSFGTFYAEFNPHTWRYSDDVQSYSTTGYYGLSVGFNYFTPFAGPLGFDAGLKLQYLFRRSSENDMKDDFEMLSLTLPVDLAYDWHVSSVFAVFPYAGIYGRYNLAANSKWGPSDSFFKYNRFKEGNPLGVINRFQVGWQAGVNFRFNDVVTLGGAYWMDFNEVTDHHKMYGFNVTLGANF